MFQKLFIVSFVTGLKNPTWANSLDFIVIINIYEAKTI